MKGTLLRATVLAVASLVPTLVHAQSYSNSYWLTANYIAVLGRQPDAAGWIWWMGVLSSGGVTQTQLTADFMADAEYCGFFSQPAGCSNPPSDSQFLTTLYQNALGRAPDQSGWNYWIGQLASGVARTQVVSDFIGTSEFQGKYGGFYNTYTAGYANPLAYTTATSVVGGAETSITVTYASSSGTT